ncbi:lipopolysaccharide kinase [Planctopirus limnophila DSM 3776]|uniref:Lipopolysaccharide kinase n=1 Tax=Planctopirus limnophila (strain ATCC 43296 / DSM 3776 / IFAM 1008 / Mu 290) TaxID=521674 RepID=D5SSJ7_PLAL2|nr:lipopolysaccharide kinase InaA family protein [Planctopirus limnophila]ADG66745.1 lipopolysaccharide kinase [Planctopirus limnophila DSM 3776]
MKKRPLEVHDAGRVEIFAEDAPLFREHGLLSAESLWHLSSETAKNLRAERVTSRFELQQADGTLRRFYIKRHSPSSLKEWIKPLLRGQWPQLGAQHEWEALWLFVEHQLPTMQPVALFRHGRYSGLITRSLEGSVKLSELYRRQQLSAPQEQLLLENVARLTARMHGQGFHHQDYYLGHLMVPEADLTATPWIIDLGRVRHCRKLARRWIVKDLAQLNYSASQISGLMRLRFLKLYLGRSFGQHDLSLIRSIMAKTSRIARHSRKNQL